MKKLSILLLGLTLGANECASLQECMQNANFYQFDREDEKNASVYYKIACEKYESYNACKALSDIYKYSDILENSKLSKKYKNKTIKIAKEQCKNNNAEACYDYANYCEVNYTKCEDYEKIYKQSFDLYTAECENKNYSSCYYLANMYFNGTGTNINEEKALDLHKYACFNKDNKSCYEVAQHYENKSLEFLRKSCELGFKYACEKLDNIR
ncbi:sel1 repeat family protein [Campylobacter sp. Cr9]|uniref:tetratricopeptide repeat protein n=1 Tax=Campylobacter sp. Cr9 TaxID=2735728 RepID=UPI0030146F73|nr:sel1 repeat family protein [Campylobacter sp. Cr9]